MEKSKLISEIRTSLKESNSDLGSLTSVITDYYKYFKNNNHNTVRKWLPKADTEKVITQLSTLLGSEITSKKGELPETDFNCIIKDIKPIDFGIKVSITNEQLGLTDPKDKISNLTIDALEKFITSSALALGKTESVVFVNSVIRSVKSIKKNVFGERMTSEVLNKTFQNIESNDWTVDQIFMTANEYATIRCFGKNFYDEATTREIVTTGLYGNLWTANLRVVPLSKSKEILFVGFKQIVDKKSHALEYFDIENTFKIKYSTVQHADYARVKHVFELRDSIAANIIHIDGLCVLELDKYP